MNVLGSTGKVAPLPESEVMVDAVDRCGGKARLTVYRGVGHNSRDRAYDVRELYNWLLTHAKELRDATV